MPLFWILLLNLTSHIELLARVMRPLLIKCMESSQTSKQTELSSEIRVLHPEIDTCISIEGYSFVCLQRTGATEGEVSLFSGLCPERMERNGRNPKVQNTCLRLFPSYDLKSLSVDKSRPSFAREADCQQCTMQWLVPPSVRQAFGFFTFVHPQYNSGWLYFQIFNLPVRLRLTTSPPSVSRLCRKCGSVIGNMI
jgi:hypothetical protein